MNEAERVRVKFDVRGDVLYVSLGTPVAAFSESRSRGILLRFDEVDEKPCGLTVLGFSENRWDDDIEELAELIAKHFKEVRAQEILEALHKSAVGALHH